MILYVLIIMSGILSVGRDGGAGIAFEKQEFGQLDLCEKAKKQIDTYFQTNHTLTVSQCIRVR